MVMQSVTKDGVLSIYGDAPTMTPEQIAEEHRRRQALMHPTGIIGLRRVELPAPVRPDPRELRATLRQAHEARAAAKLVTARAAGAAERAKDLVDAAQRDLDAMVGIDAEVARHHADSIRGGLVVIEVPVALAARLKAKVEAETKLEQLGAAKAQLAAESAQAQQAVAEAESSVADAAAAVVLSVAEEIADKVEAAKAEMEAQLSRLAGVAAVWSSAGNGKPGPLPLSPRLQTIIAAQGGPRHDAR